MVQVRIFLLQGEIKFTPKFTPAQLQHVRNQFAQPINHLDLNNMESKLSCKKYPIEIRSEKEIDDEFDYIVGLLQLVKPKVKFSGEIFGCRYSSDANAFKKCRWFVRKDEKYLTYEYIEFRIVKPSKPRAPKPNIEDRIIKSAKPKFKDTSTQTSKPKPKTVQSAPVSRKNSPPHSPQRRNPIPMPQIRKLSNQSTQSPQVSLEPSPQVSRQASRRNSPPHSPQRRNPIPMPQISPQRSPQSSQRNSPPPPPQRSPQRSSQSSQRNSPPPPQRSIPALPPPRPESPLDPNDKYASLKDGHQIEEEVMNDYMKLLKNKGKDRNAYGKLLVLSARAYTLMMWAFDKGNKGYYDLIKDRELPKDLTN